MSILSDTNKEFVRILKDIRGIDYNPLLFILAAVIIVFSTIGIPLYIYDQVYGMMSLTWGLLGVIGFIIVSCIAEIVYAVILFGNIWDTGF